MWVYGKKAMEGRVETAEKELKPMQHKENLGDPELRKGLWIWETVYSTFNAKRNCSVETNVSQEDDRGGVIVARSWSRDMLDIIRSRKVLINQPIF